MNLINPTLHSFKRLSLADIESVSLLNRTDHKYCLHRSALPAILELLKPDHAILDIEGQTIFSYENTYFDTEKNQMYLDHQNEKGNRYKIRLRRYVQTQSNFLEIKLKTNKGRTIKRRIERDSFSPVFNRQELDFIQHFSPFQGTELTPRIQNNFERITLIDKELTDRITIDLFPGFESSERKIALKNLVIIEVKQNKNNNSSRINEILKAERIPEQGFSKYCIGLSLLDENIKKNNFKPLLLKINRNYL